MKSVNCLICKRENNFNTFCIKLGYRYLQCPSCNHIFVKEIVSEEELHSYYANRKSHHSSFEKEKWDYSKIKYQFVYRRLLKKINRFSESGRLLDIGCSNGSFVSAAQDLGWEAYGIELEKDSFEIAKRHGLKVYNKDLFQQGFPDNYFSIITLWQVIEHLSDPIIMLNEINRILKPNGLLVVSTPNIQSIGWKLLNENWRAVEPQVHINLFSCLGLKTITEQNGFKTKLIETLDIKPSTIKQYLTKKKNRTKKLNSVAELASSISSRKMTILFWLRTLLNIPLKIFELGEDIYGYFIKE